MPEKKAKKVWTIKSLLKYEIEKGGSPADITGLDGQCGASLVSELAGDDGKVSQAARLAMALYDEDYNVDFDDPENVREFLDAGNIASQVVFTDVVHMEKSRWAAAKKIAYKGPITVNPNTKNRIRVYIVTKEMIPKIANS